LPQSYRNRKVRVRVRDRVRVIVRFSVRVKGVAPIPMVKEKK
jgi:hypothetical protein